MRGVNFAAIFGLGLGLGLVVLATGEEFFNNEPSRLRTNNLEDQDFWKRLLQNGIMSLVTTPSPTTAQTDIAPPTETPVALPTEVPVAQPTSGPVAPTTETPVAVPTIAPVVQPTSVVVPTIAPTTETPVAVPTIAPVAQPTSSPVAPTIVPIAPTLPPAVATPPPTPIATDRECIDDITEINVTEENLDPALVDTPREYILCPGMVQNLAQLDENGNVIEGTGPTALFLRSYAVVKCGEDGLLSNSCTLQNGSTGIDIFYSEELDADYGPVLVDAGIQGVTFRNFTDFAGLIWGYTGNFDFENVAFIENSVPNNVVNIGGGLDITEVDGELSFLCAEDGAAGDFTVTFSNSFFEDNEALEDGVSMVAGLCPSQTLVFEDSLFQNNDITGGPTDNDAALVTNFAGGLELNGNCFEGNTLGALFGPVLSFRTETQPPPQATNNYVDTPPSSQRCEFLSDIVVEDLVDLIIVSQGCLEADLDECPL